MDVEWWVQRIYEKMERECIPQAEVARAAGISRQRVNDVLRGRTKSKKAIRAMLRALGIGGRQNATGYN